MEEFLKQYYALITYGVELLAAVTGLLCLKKYKTTAAKYFIYFLVYVFILELLGNYPKALKYIDGAYLIKDTLIETNYWWFNLFGRIGFSLFLSIIFYNILTIKIYKKIIKHTVSILITIAFLYSFLNFQSIFKTSDIVLTFISLSLILTCLVLYFLEMLQSYKVLNFYNELYFYISSAFLIWYLITTPLIFYQIYFSTADWSFIFLKWQIFLFANVFMYLTFTFALIYCKPEKE
ncbi:hypothetical protein [Aquaticitalea lipolytica]|uniref:hypothetical protein n=1 Tax=Aquaticitalea lipolytica TaxID=1247562 RepID=UPI0024BB969B|nr:hypothetical protein [Aquaticitalea lipolytica]